MANIKTLLVILSLIAFISCAKRADELPAAPTQGAAVDQSSTTTEDQGPPPVNWNNQGTDSKDWNSFTPDDTTQQAAENTDEKPAAPVVYDLPLEDALHFAPTIIQCGRDEDFEGYRQAIQSWIEILSNPDNIDKDLDLLRQVKNLMEFAKQTIEDIEKSWKSLNAQQSSETQVQGAKQAISISVNTNLIQLPGQVNELIAKSETKLPKMYPNKMKEFLAKVRSISTDGTQANRQEIIIEILSRIDVLIDQLRALQIKRPDFPKYIIILNQKIEEINDRQKKCIDAPAVPANLPEDVVVTPVVQQPKSIEVERPDDGYQGEQTQNKTKSIELNGTEPAKQPEPEPVVVTKDGQSVVVDNQKEPKSAALTDGDKVTQADEVYVPKSGTLSLVEKDEEDANSQNNNQLRRDSKNRLKKNI